MPDKLVRNLHLNQLNQKAVHHNKTAKLSPIHVFYNQKYV